MVPDGSGFSGRVEMGLSLGAQIVHEVRLTDGRFVKVAQPRAMGVEPTPTGAIVTLAPTASHIATAFRDDS